MCQILTRNSTSPISWRSILFGLIILPFEVYWVTIAEMKYGSQATALPLFIYPIFILFCLVILNHGLLNFLNWRFLTTAELLTIYVMLVIGTSVSAYGMLQDLFAVVVYPYRFASDKNEWRNLFFQYIPQHFTVSNPNILIGYYEGDSSLYRSEYLHGWLYPTVTWISFTVVLLLMMHCLNTINSILPKILGMPWDQHGFLFIPLWLVLPSFCHWIFHFLAGFSFSFEKYREYYQHI